VPKWRYLRLRFDFMPNQEDRWTVNGPGAPPSLIDGTTDEAMAWDLLGADGWEFTGAIEETVHGPGYGHRVYHFRKPASPPSFTK
jgi:hypothetical protein